MADTISPIPGNVRAELARTGLSGRRLALELGWPHHIVAARLSGDVPFKADELAAIATHLGIPVARFYEAPDAEQVSA